MPKPFATVADVAKRANMTITTSEEIALAEILLEIVSEDIRAHGADWVEPILAPAICRTTAIKAAARGYMNGAGIRMERWDTATFERSALFTNGEALSEAEQQNIARAAGRGGFMSVAITRPVFAEFTQESES